MFVIMEPMVVPKKESFPWKKFFGYLAFYSPLIEDEKIYS